MKRFEEKKKESIGEQILFGLIFVVILLASYFGSNFVVMRILGPLSPR